MRHRFLLILFVILSIFSVSFAQDISLADIPICAPEANPNSSVRQNQLLYISVGIEPNFEGGGEGEPEPIWGDVEAERNVFLIDGVTGSERKIADGFSRAYWSPNGQQLALVRNTGVVEDLYLLDLIIEAEPELLLSTVQGYGDSYRLNSINWLSDGQKIIFSLEQPNPLKSGTSQKGGIYVLNLKTKQLQPILLDDTLNARYPAVSPDGNQIAFLRFDFDTSGSSSAYLYIMNVDGSNPHQLVDSEIFTSPVWSPDSLEIGYSKENHGPVSYAINVATQYERFLTRSNISPRWSPDGKYILQSPLLARLYRMDADGGSICLLVNHEAELQSLSEEYNTDYSTLMVSIGAITWSSDAEQLAYAFDVRVSYFEPNTGKFLGEEPVYSQVWTMNRDGTNRRQLMSIPVTQLVWRPNMSGVVR